MAKSTKGRVAASRDRTIRVETAVLALGASVLAATAVQGIKRDIEQARGDAWVDLPYGRARSYYDTIELMIIRKGVRTMGQKLIEWDDMAGVMRVSTFGKVVMKKLEANILKRLGAGTVRDSGLILGTGG